MINEPFPPKTFTSQQNERAYIAHYKLFTYLVLLTFFNYIIMSESTNKPRLDFWIIGIAALLWNLMGVYEYLNQAYMTDEDRAALPLEQQPLYENIPALVTGAFAIAVFGGTLACILLLLRKKLATTLFLVSFIAVIVQMGYALLLSEAAADIRALGLIMPGMIIIVAAFLLWYARKKQAAGILT